MKKRANFCYEISTGIDTSIPKEDNSFLSSPAFLKCKPTIPILIAASIFTILHEEH